MTWVVPVAGTFPDVADHIVEIIAVGLKQPTRRLLLCFYKYCPATSLPPVSLRTSIPSLRIIPRIAPRRVVKGPHGSAHRATVQRRRHSSTRQAALFRGSPTTPEIASFPNAWLSAASGPSDAVHAAIAMQVPATAARHQVMRHRHSLLEMLLAQRLTYSAGLLCRKIVHGAGSA